MTIASASGHWIGIPASPRLGNDVDRLVEAMADRVPQPQGALMIDVLKRFLDEAIDTLVTGLCDAVQLQGVGRKTVDITVATVRGTCHMLAGRVLHGMRNDELRDLAGHMDDLRLRLPARDGVAGDYTVVPVSPALLAEIRRLHAIVHAESPRPHMADIQAMLEQFMDAVVEHFYVRTMATLRLGPIARKVVSMGYRTVHSGVHGLIQRVVPQLSDEQVRNASDFILDLIIDAHGNRVRHTTPETASA